MTSPRHGDDVPAADAAEQDLPADPTVEEIDSPATTEIPDDADPADVLEQRADATQDDDE